MRLLVTGADGLLGSAVCAVAAEEYPEFSVVELTHADCDLVDFHATKAVFDFVRPEYVIHTAAVVGGIGSNMRHPGRFFCTNITINTNVLESARRVGVASLISYMSTCVFPDSAPYPLNIQDIHRGPPHPSNAAYAHAKRMLDVQSRAYRLEYGCNFITLVPANMYGPHDNWDLQNGHVLPSLIHRCYLARFSGEPLVVWGSGRPLREFLFSEDVARISLRALQSYMSPDPLIISSGDEVTISDAVQLVAELLDFKGEIQFDLTQPDGQYRKPSDTSAFWACFPDVKFTPIRQGLARTVSWFCKNYPFIRGADSNE